MRAIARSLLVVLMMMFVATPAATASASDARRPRFHQPVVVSPYAAPYGHTYGYWSAVWWRYVFSVPATVNPLLDTTGRNCGIGQYGRVFFLGGQYNYPPTGTTTVNRACRVPYGKSIFFPILNNESENTIKPGDTPTNYTFEQLLAACKDGMDGATNLSATVDGVPIGGLDSIQSPFRAAAPAFPVTPPEGNLLQLNHYIAPGGQTITPVAADGYYLMLAPMRRGFHNVHFRGTLGQSTLDVNYRLYVG